MSGLYSDDILEEVARANDIVEVVRSYFPLKRAGKDYVALCPFHAEKTPSFSVSPSKQIFKCFGCGRGGGVYNFVMLKENVTFPEAVRLLADRAGVELKTDPEAKRRASRRQTARKVLEWATRTFQKNLSDETTGGPARDYLASRGLTDASIEAFRIGFAPDGWDHLLAHAQKAGVPLDLLEKTGLVSARDGRNGYYDRFRNRVIFPILDTLNRPVAFGGRTLGDDNAKYLNSPETPLFHKSEHVYGLPQARDAIEDARRVVVVEGYTDVVMAHQVGVANVIATLGTSLTRDHVRLLKRYADEVVLVFDSDQAGQRAADRGLELFLAEDVGVYVTTLPEGTDPFDICAEQGAEAMRAHLDEAVDAVEYKWRLVRQAFDAASSPAAERRALRAMLETLAKAPALAARGDALKRDLLLGRIGRTLGVTEEALRRELAQLRRRGSSDGDEESAEPSHPVARGPRWVAERDLMTGLVHYPTRVGETLEALPSSGLADETFGRLLEAIAEAERPVDGDIASLVGRIDDQELGSLAVNLYERGQRILACRDETDTGPGPLARQLEEAVVAVNRLHEEDRLADRGKAARSGENDPEALRDFAEARKKHQGFLPPSARRRRDPNR